MLSSRLLTAGATCSRYQSLMSVVISTIIVVSSAYLRMVTEL